MHTSTKNLKAKSILLLSLLLSANATKLSAQNTWVQKSDIGWNAPNGPSARMGAVGFSIGTKGYLGTGEGNNGLYNDFWEYDPADNSWTQKADFAGTARSGAVGFAIGTKGYVGTGAATNDFWEYDPDLNTWTQRADFMGATRWGAVSFSIGSMGYVGTGKGISDTCYNDFWKYDPDADAWTQIENFGGTARCLAVSFSIDSNGYVGGGGNDYDNGNVLFNDFWEYDPDVDTWTQKSDFGGEARSGAVGFSIGSKGFVGLGKSGIWGIYTYYKDFWEYDPVLETWTQKPDWEGTLCERAVGFSIGDEGFVGTGYNHFGENNDWGPVTYYYNDFWEYNNGVSTWNQKAFLGGSEYGDAVGFSIGTKGYIGTGYLGSAFTKSFWEYNPDDNTWTQKADFGGIARSGAVGFSIGDKGYVGTGQYADTASIYFCKDFWEYDPALNTWTQKADFGGTARSDAIGLGIGSKGYVGTGQYGDTVSWSYYKDFWEYDPTVDAWTQKTDFGGSVRGGAVAFCISDKGYVGTGTNTNDFWEYDPDADEWTQKADFGGFSRSNAVSFSIGNKGYIGTGMNGLPMKDFWEYNPSLDTWMQKTDFGGVVRQGAIGFSIGSKGYIGSGFTIGCCNATYNFYKDFWEYTPDVAVGISFINEDASTISISPNPTNGEFTLSLAAANEKNDNAKIEVLNLFGQIIISENTKIDHGKMQQEIQLNDDSSQGIYLVKVTIGDQLYMAPINLHK